MQPLAVHCWRQLNLLSYLRGNAEADQRRRQDPDFPFFDECARCEKVAGYDDSALDGMNRLSMQKCQISKLVIILQGLCSVDYRRIQSDTCFRPTPISQRTYLALIEEDRLTEFLK